MKTTCAGVYRNLGRDTAGSCSLGRHCTALTVVSDPDAYADAHTRFSDASAPLDPATRETGFTGTPRSGTPRSGDALLDVIADAMNRLDEINPPRT